MKHLLLAFLTFTLLAACGPRTPTSPVDRDTPAILVPQPGEETLTRGAVYLDSVDLLTMESYPLQFSLLLKGNLPTPCNKLRVAVSPPDADKKIIVNVYSVSAPDTVCIQMLEPFSVNFPMGSFPSGHYTLWVNGEQVAELDV
jgi:hypothetical protein